MLLVLLVFNSAFVSSQSEREELFNTFKIPHALSFGGSLSSFTFSEVELSYSESIGQSSVIGTFQNGGYTLLQGYQQPVFKQALIDSELNTLNALVYPNPFDESLTILIYDLILQDIYLEVTDISGRNIISKRIPPSQLFNLEASYLPGGIYLIKIKSGNKQFAAKSIKQ